MRIYDRDFRYLLVNLVPQHRLSPELRRDVGRALQRGDAAELRRESVRALEALCQSDYFERTGVRSDDGSVVVGYRKRGGRFQLSVALPRSEWDDLGDPPRAPQIVLSSEGEGSDVTPPPGPTAPIPPPSAAPETPDLLPDVIRSFAIADGSTPVWERLEVLLESLERWLGFGATRLDVLEDAMIGGGGEAQRVHVVSEPELRATREFRLTIESGARRVVHRGEAQPLAGEPDAWDAVGVAPIFALGNVVGALAVFFPPGAPRDTMDANLELAAGVVRQAIEFNLHFESLTSIDSLTGIYNRHFFDRQMPVEIERAMRSGSALSMLVLDLDDFKRINDENGHKKGDEALVAVADIIRKNLRKVDLAFRYGGEEIVILLPGTPEFEAVHTAERLRRVIHQHRGFRDVRGAPRELTVSVGVAVYPDTPSRVKSCSCRRIKPCTAPSSAARIRWCCTPTGDVRAGGPVSRRVVVVVVWIFSAAIAAGVYRSLSLFVFVVVVVLGRAVLLRAAHAWLALALVVVCGVAGIAAIEHARGDRARFVAVAQQSPRDRVRLHGWVCGFPQSGRYGTAFPLATHIDGRPVRVSIRAERFDISYGDSLSIDAKLSTSSRTTFDYLASRGVAGEGRARFQDIRRRGGAVGCPLLREIFWPLHRAARTRLARALGADAALPVGLLLGERGMLDRAAYQAVRTLGIAHLLALSGMHLTMIAVLAVAATHAAPRRRDAAIAIALSLYVGVVGDIDSLTRAWLMALLLLGARTLVRPPRPADALGTALLLMLLWRPCSILSVGLQLSFAATLALLVCAQRLPKALVRPPSSTRPRWVRIGTRTGQGAAVAFIVSAGIELFIAPLQLHHFGQLSVVGPVATVAFLVPVSIVQALSLAASFDLPAVGGSVAWLLSWASGVTRDAIVAASSFAPEPVALAPPQWVAYYAAVCVVCWRPRAWGTWGVAATGIAIAFLAR